jgi:hypothetical protein
MTQNINQNSVTDESDPLLKVAESRLVELNTWWPRLWGWNCWLTGIAVILSGFVPFGLGLLLYIPIEYDKTLNIILIVAAAIGFIAHVWNVTQRNRDRALHLRDVASELESAIASYRSGVIGRDDFSQRLRQILGRNAQEPAP